MFSIPRLLVVLSLACVAAFLFREAHIASSQEEVDGSRVVMLFGGVVIIGAAAGTIFVFTVLPEIGDKIGNFFFNPAAPITENPHSRAQAHIAKGEYGEAVAEYQRLWTRDPSDTLALSEIAHLFCDKLHDPQSAAAALEAALAREWLPNDVAFLTNRLVDVYCDHLQNTTRARTLLRELAESLPGTRHAANALHRLQEIDRSGMR